jgi:hypothetical protein
MPQPCKQLEGYLDGSLDPELKPVFEAHLETCPACRAEVEADRRLDRLLAKAAAALESAPPQLLGRIEGHLAAGAARRRAWRRAGALAAAALLLAASAGLALRLLSPRSPGEPLLLSERDELPPELPAAAEYAAPPPARVEFDPASPLIAVPVRTGNRNLSIVFVYPQVPADPE